MEYPGAPEIGRPPPWNMSEKLTARREPLGQTLDDVGEFALLAHLPLTFPCHRDWFSGGTNPDVSSAVAARGAFFGAQGSAIQCP
jgi:hypothetical protein